VSSTPTRPQVEDVAKALTSLRSMPRACDDWHNLIGSRELVQLPDVVTQEPNSTNLARRAQLAQRRIKADVGRLGAGEDARILRMMLALGRADWSDPHLTIGERRKRYIKDKRSTTRNLDTLRTKKERRASERLGQLLLERTLDPPETPNADSSWIEDAGIELATLDFYHSVDWEALLLGAKEIDLFFTYARTWRRQLGAVLPELRQRTNPQLRLILPSIFPPRTTALPEIAKRAGQSPDGVATYVAGSYAFYERMGARIFTLDAAQLYASYRFDDIIVASLYNHQRSQTQGVPTLVCRSGGSLYSFFRAEFDALVDPRNRVTKRLPKNWRALCSSLDIEIIES